MRILTVEDDKGIAECIQKYLEAECIVCDIAYDNEDIMHKIQVMDYNLILLDINLPNVNGLSILQWIREGKINIPVIIISASSDTESKIKALGIGADDYMQKPFSIHELRARIKAVTRRYSGFTNQQISCGDMVLNQTTGSVVFGNQEIELSKKEFAMLELLLLRQNALVKKETFLDHLYTTISDEPNHKIIDVLICKLRKKIDAAVSENPHVKNYPVIKTVWGRGYIMHVNTNQNFFFTSSGAY